MVRAHAAGDLGDVLTRVLAAVGVFAVGGALGFAIARAFDGDAADERRPEPTRSALASRTYTLRTGDAIVRPGVAVRCEASAEGGLPNLFCSRVGREVHQVIFYADCVLVWPLARGPDGPPFTYRWAPKRRCR